MIEELDVIALTHPFPCPPTAVFRRTPFARAADSCFPENPSHARPGEGDPLLLTQLFRQMDLIEPFVPLSSSVTTGHRVSSSTAFLGAFPRFPCASAATPRCR